MSEPNEERRVSTAETFSLLSPVKVEMKGPHEYSSPADWPLMMVCLVNTMFWCGWLQHAA